MVLCARLAAAGVASSLANGIREISLDPEECFRVRELNLTKEDARIFLTDGYLIFSKPVAGRPIAAVFTADVEGGDAEVLVMPPNRAERRSLASYTGSPTFNEHFAAAVLLFTDNTATTLLDQIRANPFNSKSAEMGALMADNWTPVVRNIASSFQTRLAVDLLAGAQQRVGFFAAAVTGKTLGNFDLVWDPRGVEQVVLGQINARDNRTFFDVWTSFESRSVRKAGRIDPDAFRIMAYRIDATLAPDLQLDVVTRIHVRPQVQLSVLPFDLTRDMHVSAATVDGQPAEVFQRESLRSSLIRNTGNDMVLVVPPEPLAPGRDYELELRHEGKVVFEAGNHVYFVGARGNWYPYHGVQFATFDLTFRYPRGLDLVTPGDVVNDRTEGDWRITRRRTPVPVRLAGFNLGRYEHVRVGRGPYTVEVYANRTVEQALQPRATESILVAPPGMGRRRPEVLTLPAPTPPSPSSRLQELASETASALEFMTSRFGAPALRSLTVAPVPGTFGQGFPGLIYLSTLAYFGRQDAPVAHLPERQQIFYTQLLHAHEIAHQWWGNVVTSAGYHDDWIMEALANYSALLYLEKRKGAHAMESVLDEYRGTLLDKTEKGQTVESAGPIVLGIRLESSQTPMAWRRITYEKGSWIIHMLRRRMGDERFLSMLAQLRRRYEFKPITTEQFRALAAEFLPPRSADPKLEDFFDRWVYGTGIPALRIKYAVKGKVPSVRVSGTIAQSDVDEEFSALVPVEMQLGRGRSMVEWVQTGPDPVPFSVVLKQAPLKVVLDPGGAVLKK